MQPLASFPAEARAKIRYVLTDIDDTLTYEGRLPGLTFLALERLREQGFKVIPVTAGSSGWCDLIVRMWPVDAVIAENGGLYFRRESSQGVFVRHYWSDRAARQQQTERLHAIATQIRQEVPGTALAPDQPYRDTTIALTAADGTLPEPAAVDRLTHLFQQTSLRVTTNSMWVLAWAGDFDKLTMSRRMMAEAFGVDIEASAEAFLYAGDSLNDQPMFRFFPNSIGVSTVRRFLDRLSAPPRWVTRGPGGAGFVEIADMLLRK
jgi:HAD superfamily hydrolase (TIGR01484 family)